MSFQGCTGSCTFDGGGIRLDNPTSNAITVQQVTVIVGSGCTFSIWPSNMTLPARQTLILAQEGSGASSGCSQGNLFDTSDAPSISCTPDGIVPVIQVTINGVTTSYSDTRQVLNTGGFDLASCPSGTNESHQWQLVGGGPTANETRGGGSPSIRHRTTCQRGKYPVNCATGEFWHTFDDVAIPGRGIPLDFARTYSSLGASQNGPLGFGWTHSYNMSLAVDPSSGVVTINEESGSQVAFTPTPSGYQPPSRVVATLVKNSDGSYTFSRWSGDRFQFNSGGQLTQESDRNGYTTLLAYNSLGQLSSVTDAAGRALTLTYSAGLLTSVGDSTGRSLAFGYDGNGNLTSATDVNGGVTRFTYDANHLLLTMTDPRGGVVTNAYDASGRVTTQSDPMNHTTSYSYDSNGTTITDPAGNVEVEQYQNNELTSLTEGSGTASAATWTYSYDPNTLGLTSVQDPNGHTWTNTYDSSGNLLTRTDPLNRRTTYTYDALNDVTSITDPLGETTTLTYDSSGRLLSMTRPLTGSTTQTQATSFAYGDAAHPGDLTSVTDPDGKLWAFGYDQNGDLVSTTDPLGNKTTSSYDAAGRPVALVSAKGNQSGANPSQYTTSYSYNAFGDVTKVIDQLGHAMSFVYDGNRNRTATVDASGHQISYTYDLSDENTTVKPANGTTLTYGYDANGNLASQADGAGRTTSYGYDALNRVVSTTDPLGRTTTFRYDGAGNRTAVIDASGQTTTYNYDLANQLTGIVYSDGKTPSVTYAYDAAGRRTGMTDGTGSAKYSYDSLNRLIQTTNGAGQTVGYAYDIEGRLTSLTYPNGQGVTRSYDGAGHLISIADWLGHSTTFAYDANGNMVGETYPNSVQASYTYDSADQLQGVSDTKSGTALGSFSYGRDANGEITSDSSTGMGQGSQSYGYDPVNRLTSVNSSNYAYDAADNLTKLISGATLSYDSGGQLATITQNGASSAFSFDARGNRVSGLSPEGTAATYSYDQANRLTGFQTAPPAAGTLISGGGYHSLAARSDGTAWAWGYNVFGQLGNGTTTNSSVPVEVTGLVGVTGVAAGNMHSLALRADGTVWAWGYGGKGQLGNGSTANSTTPVQVPGLGAAASIAAGSNHSLARKRDGTVAAWGDNAGGELGNGSTANSSTPVSVLNLSSVIAVAGGGMPNTPGHSLALKADGTVWAWGYNKYGQVGNGSTTNASTPVQVSGLNQVVAIAAGGNDSYALKSDGTVWAWGDNSTSELGNSTAGKTSSTPVQVNVSGVSSISAGSDFGLAVKTDGTAWGWGDDSSGQLGDGGSCGKPCVTPVQARGLSGVAAAAGAYVFTLAITGNGAVYAWGQNSAGQLGNGTTASSSTPTKTNDFGTVSQAPSSASYSYDGDGLRASKRVGSTLSQFSWNLTASVPTLLSDGTTSYIYGPGDIPVEQVSGSTPEYFHTDQLGSIRLMTDGSGSITNRTSFDPYGNVVSLLGAIGSSLGFAGQYRDTETGFQYLLARSYDPPTGQFVSVDPAVSETGHAYSYVGGDPLNGTDANGRCFPVCLLVGAAVGAAVGLVSYGITTAVEGKKPTWQGAAVAMASGAVAGAIAPLVATAIGAGVVGAAIGGFAGGFAGGAVGSAGTQYFEDPAHPHIDFGRVFTAGLIGGAFGALGAGIFSRALPNVSEYFSPYLSSWWDSGIGAVGGYVGDQADDWLVHHHRRTSTVHPAPAFIPYGRALRQSRGRSSSHAAGCQA